MNTPLPCARCKHLYVDAMVPDRVIETSPDLVGRSCKLGRNMPYTDMPAEVCPMFEEWDKKEQQRDREQDDWDNLCARMVDEGRDPYIPKQWRTS